MGKKKVQSDQKKAGPKKAGRAKGTGSIQKHGKTWRATWMVDGKRFVRSTGTADQRLAEERLNEFVAPYRLRQESAKEKKAARKAEDVGMAATASALETSARAKQTEAGRLSVPLSKAWDLFMGSLTRRPLSPGTARMYEAKWNAYEAWMAEHHPKVQGLADVDTDMVQAFMRNIKAQFAPKTFNDYRALLMMVWQTLDKDAGLDGFNPWKAIATLDKETHKRRELTVEELMRVVEPLTGEMRVLFALGIYTGLRLGDCVNLDWGAVDLVRGFVQWTPHKTKKHGTVVRIPIFPALAAILAETPAKQRRGKILPKLAEEYNGGRGNHFTSERVRKAFVNAGIETRADTGRANLKHPKTTRKAVEVGFHSLRHTFVSLCANAGVPLHVVQAIVGHTNTAMTQHYFHVSDDALRGAVAVLPDVFQPPAALPPHEEVTTDENTKVETVEAVPASVAKIARMLEDCSPTVLAKAEKMLKKWLARENDK